MVNLTSIFTAVLGLATLTSAIPTLEKRKVTCRDDLDASNFGKASEAAACIDYLASLGDQPCVATISGQSFCRRGNTQITGLARNGNTATSSCRNVARGAGLIMDRCTRPSLNGSPELTIKGANEAWGNGNLLVDIRNVPQ